jgi:hypothetical protein
MALVAQHAFDSAIRLARGDDPRVALAALGARGPLIPGESPMGSAWQVAAHRL